MLSLMYCIWLDCHLNVQTHAHLSVLMWLMKLAAVSHSDGQAALNYLREAHYRHSTLLTVSPISLCLFLLFNLPTQYINGTQTLENIDISNIYKPVRSAL